MLQSIGQGRVNSLNTSSSVDAENAEITLTNTTREVQSRGWWFNREYDYPLVADADGHILLPNNCLSFAARRDYATFLVERGGRLYDRINHTDSFEPGQSVCGSIVWHLPFDDLPHVARQYIGRRAGREFQIGAVGADLLYKFTREMEAEAEAEMLREHLRVEQPNAITDNASVFRTVVSGRSWR
jgi:hypothetical protein